MFCSRANFALFSGCFLILAVGCGGSGSSGTGSTPTNNPTPTVSSLSPSSAPQYASALSLGVIGTGFVSSSQVLWGGTAVPTIYSTSNSLLAQVPAASISTIGSVDVTVANPGPGGGTSNALQFSVGNPVPILASISPSSGPAGGPTFTLTATGSHFVSGAVIKWNGASLPTTFVSASQLTAQVPASDLVASGLSSTANVTVVNPTPNGGTSSAVPFTIVQSAAQLVKIDTFANDIVWDAAHSKIYASLSSAAQYGNSVVAIDPASATVGTPMIVGSEPRPLALSDDNKLLYVGIDGSGQIKRLNLPELTVDASLNLQFPVYDQGPQAALAIAVAPGHPHEIATNLVQYFSPSSNVRLTGGTAIYDDAAARANVLSSTVFDTALEWGKDASTLYGANGISTGSDLFVMSADSSGVSLRSDYSALVPSNFGRIHYDRNSEYIYSDDGRVVDPSTGNLIGAFNLFPLQGNAQPLCALDFHNGRVFFIGKTWAQWQAGPGITIESFDLKTYRKLDTLSIPDIKGTPINFLRWGSAGLAFNVSDYTKPNWPGHLAGGPIYLLDGPFVNDANTADFYSGTSLASIPVLNSMSPEMAVAGAGDTALTVTGSGFDSGTIVKWNGNPLTTLSASSTQITAKIPAASLATVGTAVVSVSSTTTDLTSVSSLAFTIAPSGSTWQLLVSNIASLDLAWDAKDSRLIIPVFSADPRYPNSIISVDPATGIVDKAVSELADPDLVRVTDDGSMVYIGYQLVNQVVSRTLPDLISYSSFGLGSGFSNGLYHNFDGPYKVGDLRPAPGAPLTTAVVPASSDSVPAGREIVIFDNGVARPESSTAGTRFKSIQWNTNGSEIYGTEGASSLYSYQVGPTGLTLDSSRSVTTNGVYLDGLHWDAATGYLYDDDGLAVNPSMGTIVGDFKAAGLVIPDSTLNRVFILGQLASQANTSNYTIQFFDKTTYNLVRSLSLNSLIGVPAAFVRWGATGLALITYNFDKTATKTGPAGMLYIINDSNLASTNVASSATSVEHVRAFPRVQSRLLSTPATGNAGGIAP